MRAALLMRRILWAMKHGRHEVAYWPYLGVYECVACGVMEPGGRI